MIGQRQAAMVRQAVTLRSAAKQHQVAALRQAATLRRAAMQRQAAQRSLPLLLSCLTRGLAALTLLAMTACPATAPVRPAPAFGGVAGALIIAHRGGSLEAPENTVAAVAHGIAAGADWQEIDVTLSADEKVVVIHDDTLDRTTSGQGLVERTTLAQLRKLTAGSPRFADNDRAALALFGVAPPSFGSRYAAQRVPTLDEILALPNGRLMIELKRGSRPAVLVENVVQAIHRADAADRVALGSMDSSLLDRVYQREPSIPLIGIVAEESAIEGMLMLPISVLAVRLDLIEAARRRAPPQVGVWAWTAYSVPMAEAAVERGAHGVITDVPEAVVKALRTPPPAVMQLSQ